MGQVQAVRLLHSETWEPVAEFSHSEAIPDKDAVMFEEVEDRGLSAAANGSHASGEALLACLACGELNQMSAGVHAAAFLARL